MRFDRENIDGVRSWSFDADLVDPCGGNRVSLPEGLWPLILGDALMGCDISDGTVYFVDPHTAERGELVAQGLQCDPLGQVGATALMRNVEDDTLAILDEDGNVAKTSVPFALTASGAEPVNPFLIEPYWAFMAPSTRPDRILPASDAKLILADDHVLWSLRSGAATLDQVVPSVAKFAVHEDVVAFQRLEDADAQDFPIQLLELPTGTIREGPLATRLWMREHYLVLDNGLYDVTTDELHAYPAGVEEDGVERYAVGVSVETGLAYHDGSRFSVWEIATGELRIDAPNDDVILPRLDVSIWDDAVIATELRDAPSPSEIWKYPLDGSAPEHVYEPPDGYFAYPISRHEVLSYPIAEDDVLYANWATGDAWVLMTNVASNAIPTMDVYRAAVFDGRRPRFYFVTDEPRSGLWVTVLPEPGP